MNTMKRAILNVASAGNFSSDRTIGEYATEIWNAQNCPVDLGTSEAAITVKS